MSDTNNDTTTIDEKKNQDSSSSSSSFISNIGGFLSSLIVIIILIILYFSSGGLILFMCKLAQSNILPSEPNCVPYTDNKPDIEKIQTNIFTTFTDPEMSMKMEIPYDINSQNKLVEIFKKYKEKSSSNFLANYFISIIESILQFNYSAINTIMNLINSTFPEPAIVGIGPLIGGFLYIFGALINAIYFIYLWFTNMSWFFKTNTNDTGDGKPQWEDVTIMSPVNWFLGAGLAILFVFIIIIGFPIVSILPILVFHNSIISSLFVKAIMNGKQISSFTIIKETLKYYKVIIVSIISLFVILLAFSNLGTLPGIFSILTVGLIYYGLIGLDIFKSIPESNLSPLVSNKQAIKTCKPSESKKFNEKGFFYNLIFGQKGGNISKELKKIGKNLSRK